MLPQRCIVAKRARGGIQALPTAPRQGLSALVACGQRGVGDACIGLLQRMQGVEQTQAVQRLPRALTGQRPVQALEVIGRLMRDRRQCRYIRQCLLLTQAALQMVDDPFDSLRLAQACKPLHDHLR
ncbi:hypothetical protein D3C81_1649650 [compost metagenome]